MSNETPDVTSSRISAKAQIIAALIGALATVITALIIALFTPFVEQWAINRSEKKEDSLGILASEAIPQKVFSYAGNNNPDAGWSTLWLIFDTEEKPIYKFEYSLPESEYGYAGLAFQFDEPQNLDAYSGVEFTVKFYEADGRVDFFIKDNADQNAQMQVAAKGTSEAVVQYKFSNFPGIEFSAIKEIGLNVDTTVITGNYHVEIKDIHFVP